LTISIISGFVISGQRVHFISTQPFFSASRRRRRAFFFISISDIFFFRGEFVIREIRLPVNFLFSLIAVSFYLETSGLLFRSKLMHPTRLQVVRSDLPVRAPPASVCNACPQHRECFSEIQGRRHYQLHLLSCNLMTCTNAATWRNQ